MRNRNIVETTLIPINSSGGLDKTLRSMVSGIETVVKEDDGLYHDYLMMKNRPLLNLILTNWAISAIAANQLEQDAMDGHIENDLKE